MLDDLKKLASLAKDVAGKAAVAVGDLNGDGKVDQQDAKIAADWAKQKAGAAADEAGRLGREAMRSDLVKDAAAGAAVGAVVALPLPVVGSVAGAAVGAGLGVYKNLSSRPVSHEPAPVSAKQDMHGELLKLSDLREKGILTESEFEEQKKRVLKGDA